MLYVLSFQDNFTTLSIRQSKSEMLPFRSRFLHYCSRHKFNGWIFLDDPYDCTRSKHKSKILYSLSQHSRQEKDHGQTYYPDKLVVHH